MRLFSNLISGLFHPLLMATYGIALVLTCTYLSVYPSSVKWAVLGGTFLTTAFFPAAFILLLIKSGVASDVELTHRKERLAPYLVIIVSLAVCTYYFHKMQMPFWLPAVVTGACGALTVAACINFFWKISAHTIGIGGLTGGVMGIARLYQANPYQGFMLLFIIAGLVAASRIYLRRHTPMQTYSGFALGFACVFGSVSLSYFISIYN
ncbi:hypothetical protein Barb6XT_01578 [Bacteroidales bacterium Barb6XT]|nr:hypothetical protein Barb6XT_01578 [Bacteroidales bacterium Barb6XT]